MSPRHRRWIVAGILTATVALAILLGSPAMAAERFRGMIISPWFPVLLVGLYLVRPFLAWPITALSVLVGFRYGLAVGLPVALLGAVMTSLIPYGAARFLRPENGLLGHLVWGSERFFDAAGDLRGVIAARLAPTPAEAISGAAGAARVSVPAFVAGTLIGEFPWTVAAVAAGASLSHPGADAVVDVRLAVASGLVAALLLARPAYRLARGRLRPVGG